LIGDIKEQALIPVRDDIPSRTQPYVTASLIAANVLVFVYELLLGEQLAEFFYEFAVVPIRYFADFYVTPDGAHYVVTDRDHILPLFTSMFMHGGWAHLIGNMIYLWIFGDNVEDRMGRFRFILFYIHCGLSASAAHIIANPYSTVPSLGASGAIAGVLGAYLILYPKARVILAIPIFFFPYFVEVPAIIFLGFWFLQQILFGTLSLGVESAQTGGIAWWAHIGGFAAGALLVGLFARRKFKPMGRDLWWREA
jgi:membrane associated rhomboid family serine protease